MADGVVFDDPPFAPVGPDEADLLHRWGCPRGGRLCERESANGDVVDSRFLRIENRPTDIDLDQLMIGVSTGKLRVNGRLLIVHLPKPERSGAGRSQHLGQRSGFRQPFSIQIDSASVMLAPLGIKPMAIDQITERIEVAEETVGQLHHPCVVRHSLPASDNFRAFDLDLLTGRGLIDDTLDVGLAATRRIDPLPIW